MYEMLTKPCCALGHVIGPSGGQVTGVTHRSSGGAASHSVSILLADCLFAISLWKLQLWLSALAPVPEHCSHHTSYMAYSMLMNIVCVGVTTIYCLRALSLWFECHSGAHIAM